MCIHLFTGSVCWLLAKDKLLNDLREQLSEERKQLNEEIRVMTGIQQPSETPRAVFAQLKSLPPV